MIPVQCDIIRSCALSLSLSLSLSAGGIVSGFLCAAETLAMAPAPVGTLAASSSITRLAPRAAPAAESCPSLPDITTLSPDYTTLDNITSPQPSCHETASLPRHSALLTSHNVTCPQLESVTNVLRDTWSGPMCSLSHCHTVTPVV